MSLSLSRSIKLPLAQTILQSLAQRHESSPGFTDPKAFRSNGPLGRPQECSTEGHLNKVEKCIATDKAVASWSLFTRDPSRHSENWKKSNTWGFISVTKGTLCHWMNRSGCMYRGPHYLPSCMKKEAKKTNVWTFLFLQCLLFRCNWQKLQNKSSMSPCIQFCSSLCEDFWP